MRRKNDEPGVRSVFRVVAPRFEALEERNDEDSSSWGLMLLMQAFNGLDAEQVDVEAYGRAVEVRVEGIRLELLLGFRGPDWLGFVNAHRALPNTPAVVSALMAIDRRFRDVGGVEALGWMDLASFNANGELWAERP